jgi:hypothetical protein
MRRNTDAQVSGGVAGGSDEGPVMGLERSGDTEEEWRDTDAWDLDG